MTDLILLPDIDLLVVDFLLDQPEVLAFFDENDPGDRVYTDLPAGETKPVFPLVRVNRFSGTPRSSRPAWMDQAFVSIEAFGGRRKIARDLAATCQAALDARLAGMHEQGVVTNVRTQGFAYHPDETYQPAKPKYDFVAVVTLHPNPAGTGS
jgi:hypothetical protein